MNKRIIIAGVIILILVGGGLFVANQQSQQAEQAKMAQEKAEMAKDQTTASGQDELMKKEEDKMMADKNSSTRYVEYSKAALDKAPGDRRVLFFYANWCPTCRPTDADLTANTSKIPEDVTVIRVNYNDTDTDQEEKDLAKKYGITYQHTFVQIDVQGKEITKWNGGQTEELLAKIK
ncbi:MAG: thioredoxin family protein [Candidatus Levybacteria bacterium]|nr:thioredoxin family protein [Candidatus Levybacteria bacterium]